MAAFIQNKSRGEASSGTDIQLTLDAAPTVSNLLVATVAVQSNPTLTTQTGWTLTDTNTTSDRGAMYYKIAGASESAIQNPADSGNDASTNPWAIIISEYVIAVGPVGSINIVNGANSDSTATKTLSSALSPDVDISAIAIGSSFTTRASNTTGSQTIGGRVATERGDQTAGSGTGGTQCSQWDLEIGSTSGTYGTTCTVTGSTFQGAIFLIIVELTKFSVDNKVAYTKLEPAISNPL